MGDPAVPIREEDLVRIGEYVRGNLKEWMQQAIPEIVPTSVDPVTNTHLLERVVRLDERLVSLDGRLDSLTERVARNEDELRALRQSVEAGARAMKARIGVTDARFAGVDARFDSVEVRFDAVDARFEAVDVRFDSVDARLADQRHHFDKRLSLLTWLIGSVIALVTGILAAMVL